VSYIDLGSSIPISAALDTSGLNVGNLTIEAGPDTINVKVGQYEIWHMVLINVPTGAQFNIFLNATRPFGFCNPNGGSEWWGRLPMRQSDTLYFLSNLPNGTTPVPQLCVYSQYDPDIPANR
jgi:hypothetical protein